jgi:holin-like protein
MMIPAFLVLLACELGGNALRQMLGLPVPGSVIGMAILAAGLAIRKAGTAPKSSIAGSLELTAEALIRHMGLLFVPAGVGLIAEIGVLRSEWLPIAAGLIGSTLLSLVVTGLVMHWSIRRRAARRSPGAVQGLERVDPGRTVTNDCH